MVGLGGNEGRLGRVCMGLSCMRGTATKRGQDLLNSTTFFMFEATTLCTGGGTMVLSTVFPWSFCSIAFRNWCGNDGTRFLNSCSRGQGSMG